MTYYSVYLEDGRVYAAALTWREACDLSRRLTREGRVCSIGVESTS